MSGESTGARSSSRAPPPRISGLVALVYEVAWTRLLVLVDRPDDLRVHDRRRILHRRDRDRIRRRRAAGPPHGRSRWSGSARCSWSTAVAASASGWFAASRLPLIVASQVADPDAAFGRVVTTPGVRDRDPAAADDLRARRGVSACARRRVGGAGHRRPRHRARLRVEHGRRDRRLARRRIRAVAARWAWTTPSASPR